MSTESEPRAVMVDADGARLEGELTLPTDACGVVLFAHGSGSSRHSSRNVFVARVLSEGGLGTLLFDLLTTEEGQLDERTREYRFDVELLVRRLVGATDWLLRDPVLAGRTTDLGVGYFGASTGAAAALIAAAARPDVVRAVVSRGGRPDLATSLPDVAAPTLLIVGGNDLPVIEMNRAALEQLREPSRLEIVPGATHLFEEPGALERVADLARDWFQSYL